MHTYSAPGGTRIFYNSDASGTAIISYDGREMEVPGGDIVPLVLIMERIASTENITVRDENFGARCCRYCKGDPIWVEKWDTARDCDVSYWDAEHDPDCPHLLATRLREGMAR